MGSKCCGERFDFRYYKYDQLTDILHALVDRSECAYLKSLGKSHRGRDIWLIEISAPTSKYSVKPAFYLDANTHAEELAGSTAALYLAHRLISGYQTDPEITRLLEQVTFYIIPRLNPDGAEICLTQPFYEWIGNGRFLPGEEQCSPGLHYADVNGDGLILDMLVRDEDGEWKKSDRDERLLLLREPDEWGGDYYRLYPEGFLVDSDNDPNVSIPRPRDGNLNRNYPYDWGPEGEEYGAGQYPISEPETAAIVDFVAHHPNIFCAMLLHTNAGVILPPTEIKGQPIPLEDRLLLEHLARLGERAMDYPCVRSEEEFNFPGRPPRKGTGTGFFYGQKGIPCFVVELWDVFREAGIEKDWYFPLRELGEEEGLALLKWNDEVLGGEGFVPWQKFNHPQFGEVEIGGWKRLFTFRNPPPGDLLRKTCVRVSDFAIALARTSPLLKIRELAVKPLAQDIVHVRLLVGNGGYLATNLTRRGLDLGDPKPVIVQVDRPDDVDILMGRSYWELGHLSGRSDRTRKYSRFFDWGRTVAKAEWLFQLRGKRSSKRNLALKIISDKAGVIELAINLEDREGGEK